ncbi:MAG: N-acetylglucosamine-6-phosphate deacetylase [Gammaproteobacteria bacterium]|nr:N-acetylglucosamine-6-phosphate deacetylase [Gammaproteobacteria bacterium]
MNMLITADNIFDGENLLPSATVEIIDGKIAAIHQQPVADAIRLPGTLSAGFIDYHVNGGGGKLFNFEPSVQTLTTMINAHAKYGTTALLPTLITDSAEVMTQVAEAVASAVESKEPGILGVHFEGPHLSLPKKGVHEANFVRPIGDTERAIFQRKDLGIKLVTLAPENVTDEDIQLLVNSGVKVSIGHSNASYERAKQAEELGASGYTHLFNAMSPFTSREPGVLGAALESENAYCGIILDGHHMHYASAKIAHQVKAKGKMLIVTDAMSTIGSDQDSFEFFGLTVKRDGDKLTTADGTLAGSALDMITAVKNAVCEMDLPLSEALNMASLYPAQYLGVDDIMGSITVGKQADLIVFNDDYQVTHTWIAGELVHQK